MSKFTNSILTNNMSKCYICGISNPEIHHIYFGKNRNNSTKYGCVVPLCYAHHRGNSGVHHNHQLDLRLKQDCQRQFQVAYPNLDFASIFYKNYL